ncbi:cytochrome b5-like heme/steroid binding domain-containing protein [Parasitella parasitica]|nr:cytochrome b5-like heme/steroid binding domain-containing protein [Parasitella parasitica]
MATEPPKTTPFTVSQLAEFNGSDPLLPIYVAIKGDIFDVSSKRDTYGIVGKGYNVFTGKDSSKALGKSSLNKDDCVADYSDLTEKELEVLDQWYTFFKTRYNIVGKVVPDN